MSPRSTSQIKALKVEKRALIMKAGLQLFAKNGYQATSIAMIASEAGISKGLMYTYFKSKEEFLRALVLNTIEEMFSLVENTLSESPDDKEFESMINANFKWIEKNEDFLRIYFGVVLQPNILRIFETEFGEKAQEAFLRISKYFEIRNFENPLLETRYLTSLLDGLFMNYIVDPDGFPLQEMKKKILNQYLNN
ncbi:TetR/AcrR family transcriptional regulator [Labilibacter sediminis]|nr:TetR/AcrR family transcriptional regulator [Labilibacter sediminis]